MAQQRSWTVTARIKPCALHEHLQMVINSRNAKWKNTRKTNVPYRTQCSLDDDDDDVQHVLCRS